jgi:myo-inositol-1(or 4)-monophosphatase
MMVSSLEQEMIAWSLEGAELARSYYRNTGEVTFKYGREAVTEADRAIETLWRQNIAARFPDDLVVGEELGSHTEEVAGRRVWQLDPIDGTLNFALGLPGFCTSMAVLCEGKILAACIVQPTTGDVFAATLNAGARLNGKAMTVSSRAPLNEALVSTQFKKDGRVVRDPALLQAMALAPLKCRRTGAIALELAWVACGGHDALIGSFVDTIHLWDVAAGLLLVQEAGGRVTDHLGQPYGHGGPDLVVSNGHIHQEILDLMAKYARDED